MQINTPNGIQNIIFTNKICEIILSLSPNIEKFIRLKIILNGNRKPGNIAINCANIAIDTLNLIF